jgi:hypothetical protein
MKEMSMNECSDKEFAESPGNQEYGVMENGASRTKGRRDGGRETGEDGGRRLSRWCCRRRKLKSDGKLLQWLQSGGGQATGKRRPVAGIELPVAGLWAVACTGRPPTPPTQWGWVWMQVPAQDHGKVDASSPIYATRDPDTATPQDPPSGTISDTPRWTSSTQGNWPNIKPRRPKQTRPPPRPLFSFPPQHPSITARPSSQPSADEFSNCWVFLRIASLPQHFIAQRYRPSL